MMLSGDTENCIPVERLEGRHVNVVALDLERHLGPLWEAQTRHKEELGIEEDLMFKHMMYGPFPTKEAFKIHLTSPIFDTTHRYVVEYKEPKEEGGSARVVGFITYMDIWPEHRRCEIGHLWLDPLYRRRGIMDEAIFLMLEHAFDVAKYRRVQWTCNSTNESSKKMALRNQFQFEGILRNQFIAKRVNRDNCYLSIIDSEWPQAKAHLQTKFSF